MGHLRQPVPLHRYNKIVEAIQYAAEKMRDSHEEAAV